MVQLPPEDMDHILRNTDELWEDLRGQSVFITGGTGFVGRWLLESLLWADDKRDLRISVVALTRDPQRFRKSAPHLAAHAALRLLAGNLAGFDFPQGRFPFVIHAAIEPAFTADRQHPLGAFVSNVDGTRRVLEFAHTHGVRRFLFTSSGAVYGKQPTQMTHIAEDYSGAPSTTDADSAYGQAKRVSEYMSTMYGRVHGFDAVIARLFTFVGPLLPLNGNYAVGNFIRDVLRAGPVRIGGDGTPYRSYLYAADLAIWLWTIMLCGKGAYPYNVGSERNITIAELARTVVGVTAGGADIEIARQPVPGASPLRYVPCTKRAQHELGLKPLITLEEGIQRTIEWHRTLGESNA